MKRILKVQKLPPECMKHIRPEKDALANQILTALLKASSDRNEPVKLSEISEIMYGTADKDKQDIIRLTMEKSLLRCGIVDKIYFAERDVRFFPAAYRFQEVQKLDTGTWTKAEQTLGEVVELPRQTWPVPGEYFELVTSKAGCNDALTKLEEDTKNGSLDPRTYQQNKDGLLKVLATISKRLEGYKDLDELMGRP